VTFTSNLGDLWNERHRSLATLES